jgi:3D (Asp-Asp-Asp) domain-containing protein
LEKWEKSSCYSRPSHGGYEAALLSSLLMAVLFGVFGSYFDLEGKRVISLHSAWSPQKQDGSVPGFAGEQLLSVAVSSEAVVPAAVESENELLAMLRSLDQDVPQFGSTERAGDQGPRKEQWRVVRMKVTAYCPCRKCCGRHADGITACNHRIRPGDVFVAADKRYSFGTEMIIPGYNGNQPVSVKDRGRLIKGNRLDVFFPSHQQAKKWGTKTLDVLVKVE